jgi:glutaredoxin 3
MIEIYGKPNCPYCVMAVNLVTEHKLEYTYKSLDKDFDRDALFKIFPTARTFPQIKVNENNIGGYQELKEWVDSNV